MGDRFTSSTNRTVYVCLDEIEGVRPRTELAVGNPVYFKAASKENLPAVSPFVVLYFRDSANNNHGIARITIPKYHDDISTELLGYIDEVKTGLVDYMKQQNPSCELKGMVGVENTDDNAILDKLKRHVRLEEILEYVI